MVEALRKIDLRMHLSFQTKAVLMTTLGRDSVYLLKDQESMEVMHMDYGTRCLGSMVASVT